MTLLDDTVSHSLLEAQSLENRLWDILVAWIIHHLMKLSRQNWAASILLFEGNHRAACSLLSTSDIIITIIVDLDIWTMEMQWARERERECKKLNTQKTIYLWWTSRNEALHINSITLNYHRMISIRAMKPSSVRCTYYTYSSTVTRTTTNCFRFHFAVIPYAYHHHQTTNTYYNKYNMCLSYYVWCERVSSVRPWLIAFSWYINGLSANSGLCNLCSAYYYGRLKNRANYYRGFSIQLLHIISKLSMFTCSPILLGYAAIFRQTAAV